MAEGGRLMAHDTWLMVHSPKLAAHGSWTWLAAYGSWTWHMAHGRGKWLGARHSWLVRRASCITMLMAMARGAPSPEQIPGSLILLERQVSAK